MNKIGRWTLLSWFYKNGKKTWKCICECGAIRNVDSYSLHIGDSKSCGCLRKEKARKHGMYLTKEFKAWAVMRQRCENKNANNYKNYGGRGIKVCPRWREFKNFWADMGPTHKEGLLLERINNNGNYERNNCRWASRAEQNRNHRRNINVVLHGEKMCLTDAAIKKGVKPNTYITRWKRGWSVERILSTPVEERGIY